MKTLVLDGSADGDREGLRVSRLLQNALGARGDEVELLRARELQITDCGGCFSCWVRSPGVCVHADDNRRVARAAANCGLLVLLTPVTFGGYSSTLKRALDHMIQNVSPRFVSLRGETRHQKRYGAYPDLLVLGWMDGPDGMAQRVFGHLAGRNALNFHAERADSTVLFSSQDDAEAAGVIDGLLRAGRRALPPDDGGIAMPEDLTGVTRKIRRAVLLTGSPGREKSSSAALGRRLLGRLEALGVGTETVDLYSAQAHDGLDRAAARADLAVLCFPLYVDTLPAPVIGALENLAAARKGSPSEGKPLFAALVNCGYPEPAHNLNALAVCSVFAGQAGFSWAGGLALGGSHGLGRKLTAARGLRARAVCRALDVAAEALARGEPIPPSASAAASRPAVPPALFRLGARAFWAWSARKNGCGGQLLRRPYAAD